MADLMRTAVSGLLAFQRALDTTSHNIANVATEGYSRQRVDLGTRPAQAYGNGSIGSGVQVTTVQRVYDAFLATQMRGSASDLSRYDTLATEAERLDNVLGSSTTGLATALQNFINAFQDVANEPSSITARQVLLSQAEVFAGQLRGYDDRLRTFASEINSRLGAETAQITTISQGIAQLNGQIKDAFGRTGQPPNDLLDQRDKLVLELAQFVDVKVVSQEDGTANVFIGSGQPLVVGQTASKLTTSVDLYDPTRLNVAMQTAAGTVDVSAQISGGSLGGLMEYRATLLDPARDSLGQIAAGLTSAVNAQHANGIDLNGDQGGDFFTLGSPTVLGARANTGTGTVAATLTDANALTGRDYVLEYSGTWQLRDASTGTAVPMTGAGTAGDPFRAAGLAFVVGGTPANGDKYRIEPTRDLIGGLEVAIEDAAEVAAASPVSTAAGAGNTGAGRISKPMVLDAGNADLRTTSTIEFLSATTYSINGAGSFTYTPGADIDINGARIQISGSPAVGDTFTIADNATGVGDNSNLLAMIRTLESASLNGGTTSLAEAAGQLVSRIGSQTSAAQSNRDAFEIVHEQDVAAQQSVSGVNLDEEAANLIMMQQAYQAAAQMIAVAQQMFDTLLNATRR